MLLEKLLKLTKYTTNTQKQEFLVRRVGLGSLEKINKKIINKKILNKKKVEIEKRVIEESKSEEVDRFENIKKRRR